MVVVGRSGAMSAAVMRPIDENLDAGARIVLIAGIVMVGGGTGVGIRTRVGVMSRAFGFFAAARAGHTSH